MNKTSQLKSPAAAFCSRRISVFPLSFKESNSAKLFKKFTESGKP